MSVKKSSDLESEDLRCYVIAFADAKIGSCLHSVKNRYPAAVGNDGEKQKTLLKDTCPKQTQKQRMIAKSGRAKTRRRCDTRSAVI